MRTYWLSTHLSYKCRHSGACCTARWPIPIEPARAAAVHAAVAADRVNAPEGWLQPAPGAPPDVAGLLASHPSGACVFHRPGDSGGCAIHPMRPAACEHFPYVCVIDPRGVHVTLSHYCPTSAALLFDDESPIRVVEGPPVVAEGRVPEGLDAREALPPIDARGARLMSWADVTRWEAAYLARLTTGRQIPDSPCLALFEHARAAVPAPWSWPGAPERCEEGWRELVAAAWPAWAPIRRYLAARAHASWAMFLGRGPADVERLVLLTRTVLQVELVRRCLANGRPPDRVSLTDAIRRSDLLLVHFADPARLCAAGV